MSRALPDETLTLRARRSGRAVIVDFGCGTGNASLPLAWTFRDRADFILVDFSRNAVDIAAARAAEAGLTNCTFRVARIEEFDEPFDLGLGTHVCGGATDIAIDKCVRAGASFVMVPCCVGKIKFSADPRPLSAWLSAYIGADEYWNAARTGDHSATDFDDAESEWKRRCKSMLEVDRMKLAQEAGYSETFLAKLVPLEASPKNDIIVALK